MRPASRGCPAWAPRGQASGLLLGVQAWWFTRLTAARAGQELFLKLGSDISHLLKSFRGRPAVTEGDPDLRRVP